MSWLCDVEFFVFEGKGEKSRETSIVIDILIRSRKAKDNIETETKRGKRERKGEHLTKEQGRGRL